MQILIADDHALVRDGLKLVLNAIDPEVVVKECSNAADALSLSADYADFDLAILDLVMPGMDGTAGIEAFRSQSPDVPVLILSGFGRRQDVVAALELGVAGFISKSLEAASMVNAIRLVLSGERYVPADIFLNSSGVEDDGDNNSLRGLSDREKEILGRLMEGLTNKEIGRHLDIEEVTVKLHLSSIYRKLGVSNRTQAVRFALDHGWQE